MKRLHAPSRFCLTNNVGLPYIRTMPNVHCCIKSKRVHEKYDTMMKNILWAIVCLFIACQSREVQAQIARPISGVTARGQGLGFDDDQRNSGFSNDSTETIDVPEGIYAWHISPRFGDIIPTQYDTIPHGFQNSNQTMGMTGHYNYTGNLGSPRVSRLFSEEGKNMQSNPFLFKLPYSFFLSEVQDILFTNTKSPFTNLTYHSCGNKQNGEDRLKALFSVNAGKRLGMGMKADYLYGRGYYQGQSTADFDGTLFASYRGEQYQMHTFFQHTYLKTRENGGIENDDYVNRPETFPTRYGTGDMPINLARAWNKIGGNQFFLTHRYSLGFRRYRDAKGNIVKKPTPPLATNVQKNGSTLKTDSLQQTDSNAALSVKTVHPRLPRTPHENVAQTDAAQEDTLKITSEFVPVSSFIHTLRIDDNTRKFISNERNNADNPGYFSDFYLPGDSAFDRTHHLGIENTFAVELHEGMNRWMKMGLRLYGKHELAKFDFRLPAQIQFTQKTKFTENYFTVGAQLIEQKSKIIRYNVLGELRTTGSDWGEFNVEADAQLFIPLKKDSIRFKLDGFVRNERPSFYYRHYYSRNAWWDNNDLKKMFHARINAQLSYRDLFVKASLENIQNYTYFQEDLDPFTNSDEYTSYHHSVSVAQASKNVQLLALTLGYNLRAGVFHWDNEITYQTSTNKSVLPVPTFMAYSNAYLLFRIAKVLRTEIGVDMRYFTRYNAPTYSPIIGQYVVQDATYATSVGNYPIINAYANFHLKRTRFYLMASHVNYSSGNGKPFLVPHYPLNRMTIHFGVSWNFIN